MTDRQFFSALAEQGPLSRADIAKLTGISKPTISESAQRLVGQGYVRETNRKTQGRQGRSGLLYEINRGFGFGLGVTLDSALLQAQALDFAGSRVWSAERSLSGVTSKVELLSVLHELVAESQTQVSGSLLATSVSLSAPVNAATGEVRALPDSHFPMGHDLNVLKEVDIDSPVLVDNDVNWATLAESIAGAAQGVAHFLFVYLGRGIGAGVYLSGQLQQGAAGLAGEIGYFRASGDETLLGRINRQPCGKWDAATLSLAGEAVVHSAILLNPSQIVLGGPLMEEETTFRQLQQEIQARSLIPLEVVPSQLPEQGPLVGAALGAYRHALNRLELRV